MNTEYEDRAKELLRRTLAERGLNIEDLTSRLVQIGVEMSRGGVANKISRGGFSAAFLLQCMDALDMHLIAEGPLDGEQAGPHGRAGAEGTSGRQARRQARD